MIHKNRTFNISVVTSIDDLAKKLTEQTWTGCQGFEYEGLLFLNDSFSENGAQEYAVLRKKDRIQIESITFSWCSYDEAVDFIRGCLGGEGVVILSGEIDLKLDYNKEHRCNLCA